jgi:hypothetical protein
MTSLRRFHMNRSTDITGTSGTGTVAEGVEFTDGTVVIRWRPVPATSTCCYASIDELLKIHGHDGGTTVEWLDEPAGRLVPVLDEGLRTCDRCGQERACEWTTDPFLAGIYPEADNPLSWWCGDCYGLQAEEI